MPNSTESGSIASAHTRLNNTGHRPWFTSLLSWRPKKRGSRAPPSLPEPSNIPVTVTNTPAIVAPPEVPEVHLRAPSGAHFSRVPGAPEAPTTKANPWLSGVSYFTCLLSTFRPFLQIPSIDDLISLPEYPSSVEEARHVMSLIRAIRDERSAIKDAATHTLQHTIGQMEHARAQLRIATDSWAQSEEGVGIVSALIRSRDLPMQLIFNTSRSHVAQFPSPGDDFESSTSSVDSEMSGSS